MIWGAYLTCWKPSATLLSNWRRSWQNLRKVLAMAETDTLEQPEELQCGVPREEGKRAEEERIDRHWANFWEQMAIIDEVLDEWRAEGILPPEEPGQRV
jgi:hypothetical protein